MAGRGWVRLGNIRNMENEDKNKCMAYHHFIFPWLCEYRCGNCYSILGENVGVHIDQGVICTKCGCTNIGSTSKLNLRE